MAEVGRWLYRQTLYGFVRIAAAEAITRFGSSTVWAPLDGPRKPVSPAV
jgi:hypothetical protein